MRDKNCMVYILKFPDGKYYVGLTTRPFTAEDTEERFVDYKNGVYEAIKDAGWDNVIKTVEYTDLSREEALERKKELVLKYSSHLPECGYNRPADAGILKSKKNGEKKPRSKKDYNNKKRKYYTVYVHITPNKKIYVGQTIYDARKRWNEGKGYQNNKQFYQDILKYGWSNINHIIICDTLNEEQADYLEEYLIKRYHATDPECGYNKHNGGNLYDTFRLRHMIAYFVTRTFLDYDLSVIKTVEYFFWNYTKEQLQDILCFIKNQSDYIDNTIVDKEFANNYKKAAYIFEIVKNHAFI